jgi:AcrR family transcriptional regulator
MGKSGFTEPVQERSARTLRRMVDAARDALETTGFDDLTLADITGRAGVTVGAFYQRFPSKDSLLEYLEREAYQEIRESSATLFSAPPPEPAPSTRELLRTFVTGMAAVYREHRGILRELVQRSRSSEARQERRMDMTSEVVQRAVDWILEQGGPVNHPEPRKALSVALLFTSSALRDVVLFGETWMDGVSGSDVDDLAEQLVQAAEAYLGLAER